MNQERQADNQKYANILGSLFHLSDFVYSSYLDYEKAFDIYTFVHGDQWFQGSLHINKNASSIQCNEYNLKCAPARFIFRFV